MRARTYHKFSYKDANFRIASDCAELITIEIRRQRDILEDYIRLQPEFQLTLRPIELLPHAPEVAQIMARAGRLAGVGPMAAVAGAIAQLSARAALEAGASEAIVENGGDIYILAREPVTVGLYAGHSVVGDKLAFTVQPADTPLSICSSSGKMGRSMSLGACDLATIVATDAALADAVATMTANMVRTPEDIDRALNAALSILGVSGVLIAQKDRVGMMGQLPQLVRSNLEPDLITGLS